MSNSYLDWAQRNFALNDMETSRHQLLRADCLEWLEKAEDVDGEAIPFDLIFLDPPTFSNSKKMESVLDIQRDHPGLIDNAMAILAPGGTLIFSNNFRKFSMENSVMENYKVKNITEDTLDPDFQRNHKIHNCWLIQHSA